MNKEFKELFTDLIKDPVAAADKMNDANYKKVLPEEIYNFHNTERGNKPWSEYIVNMLCSMYEIELDAKYDSTAINSGDAEL